jgi:hypothetical protein
MDNNFCSNEINNKLNQVKLFTPDRSKTENFDVHSISYNVGNRKHRRVLAFSKKINKTIDKFTKKIKLPKSEWIKGESKFLDVRLMLEKLKKSTL